jgi:phosphopantothenoylcysteine decarboxylase / phosphopantothenate---cysteine ligase
MKNNRPLPTGSKSTGDLSGRKVLLGVCGGIAAYKAVELCRLLIKAGARVQVIMTAAAEKFITPLTFETITGRTVHSEMFPPHGDIAPWHTELASWPDLAVIAPATAHSLARIATGLADDLLSTIMLTLERPRLVCPSMNYRMWANAATQDNVAVLRRRGYRFVMPEEGQMARPGESEGMGRLAEPQTIFSEICHILSAPQDLHGVRVLVTAGRTEESWDPVRVLTNRASGRMGFALAEEAYERGADVVLVHGPTDVVPPAGPRLRRVSTAADMAAAVKQEFPAARVVLMSAAVADYTFAKTEDHKIKKNGPTPEIRLVATEDILRSLADRKGDRIVVGFALETENLLENALKKLRDKHLDIVVANNPLSPGSGFAGETNQVLMIHRSGKVVELPLQSKREVAREILNAVIGIYRHPEPEPVVERDDVPDIEEFAVTTDADIAEGAVVENAPQMPPMIPGKKSGRGRRGGRRAQRAKARKTAQEMAQQEPKSQPVPTPAPVIKPPTIAPKAKTVVAVEGKKGKPVRPAGPRPVPRGKRGDKNSSDKG